MHLKNKNTDCNNKKPQVPATSAGLDPIDAEYGGSRIVPLSTAKRYSKE